MGGSCWFEAPYLFCCLPYILVFNSYEGQVEAQKDSKRFPMGSETLEKRPHFMKCTVFCMDKNMGELGIISYWSLNQALLARWEMGMRPDYRKLLGKGETSLIVGHSLQWVMEGEWSFGRINGVESFCVYFSSLYVWALSKEAWVVDLSNR